MIKRLYGLMDKDEKEDYSRLLCHEINSFLAKIYRTMKRKQKLAPQKVVPSQLIMKHASLGATKMWEFKPNTREKAATGDVGMIIVVTRGLKDDAVRKQRALFIAAEFYVYHAFANHHDPKDYKSIVSQNQYWDMAKKLVRGNNSHETRDHAIRYVVEEIGEHKLAHYRGKGWVISVAKLKKHHEHIADMLGSSEHTFKEIFRKQHQQFGPEMMKQEDDLIRRETEDIDHLILQLKTHEEKDYPAHYRKLVDIHLDNLKTFREVLADIMKNIEQWEFEDKEEHKELKKKVFSAQEIRQMLKAESEAEKIDINKIHILFNYFKKEKINILRDLELLDRISAETHTKKRRPQPFKSEKGRKGSRKR